MKIFVLVALALQLASARGVEQCGPCQCSTETEDTRWLSKKVARCVGLKQPIPENLPTDIEVLIYTYGHRDGISELKRNQFIMYKKLTHIYVEVHEINKIDRHTFGNMTTVTFISMHANSITEIPTGLFSDAPNVVTVGLNDNKIKVLQQNLFSNLNFLKDIELYNNEISLIEEHCFVNLPLLEKLSLYNNNLHTLSLNIMDNIQTLRYLYLDGNPWNCNETLCPLMQFVNERSLWEPREVPACTKPGNLQNQKWNNSENFQLSFPQPPFQSINERDNFTLQCKYCLANELRWTLNGRLLPINYQHINPDSITSELKIYYAQKQNEGQYRCVVRNCENCDVGGVYVKVQDKSDSPDRASNSFKPPQRMNRQTVYMLNPHITTSTLNIPMTPDSELPLNHTNLQEMLQG